MGNDLNKEAIAKMAAEVAAKTALEVFEKERKKAKKEQAYRRLRNTKLLLRNYRMFRDHAAHAVYDVSQIDEDAYAILDLMSSSYADSDRFVDSIRTSVARTITIVQHIEVMLQLYDVFCFRSANPEEERRYRVIKAIYIDEKPTPIKELAEVERVAERTIYRDIDIACERIAALIFGIDGIKKV